MSENKIFINGKSENLSIDTTEELILNWKKLKHNQKNFRIKILDQNIIVMDTQYIKGEQPFFNISIPHSISRREYIIYLEITSTIDESFTYKKVVYTKNENLKNANWITRLDNPIEKEWLYFQNKANMIFEKEFFYDEEGEAFLDICGLGYYTVKINNQRIDDTFLNNDVSDYRKTIYFDTYKIGLFLKKGKNTIAVELANGWYNPAPIKILGRYNVRNRMAIGKPCLICQISYSNKHKELITINSDKSWKVRDGKYLLNNIFIGERVLADSQIKQMKNNVQNQTVEIAGPGGELTPNKIRKIKRTKKLFPKTIEKIKENLLIDFGRVISGHFSCNLSANIHGKINIFYSEAIHDNKELNYRSIISGTYGYTLTDLEIDEKDPVIQMDEIIKGKNEFNFENMYVYHSFRYVLIECNGIELEDVEDILAYSVHTDLESASSFESSNENINLLWNVAIDTKLNNIHSYFEDCPRERLGYGGDIVALIDSQIYSFDIEQLLIKVFKDFADSQTESGGVPQTAPYMGIQTNGPSDRAGSLGWQLVFPTIAKKIKQHYFQPHFFKVHINSLMAHINYILAFDYEYIKHCCLGDWGSIDTISIDKGGATPDREFCSAIMYYLILTNYADLLSDTEHCQTKNRIKSKVDEIRNRIISEFYQETGYFQTGSQSSYAFALYSNIVTGEQRDKVLSNFLNKIRNDDGVLRGGIFGMPWTYQILSEENCDSIVFSWLTREVKPSFLEMLSNGNKILSEFFDSSLGSYNHAMFSSYSIWMVERLLGIQIKSDAKGSNSLKISPYFPKTMSYAKGRVDTVRGEVSINWRKTNNIILMIVRVPKGIEFELQLNKNYQLLSKELQDNSFYIELKLSVGVM